MGSCLSHCLKKVYRRYFEEYTEIPDAETELPTRIHKPAAPKLTATSSFQKNDMPSDFLKLYDLGNLVGTGTTAKVYKISPRRNAKVIDGQLRNLACKVIDKKKLTVGLDDEDRLALLTQLRKEVDILRNLQHPNIVSFFDYMETNDKVCLITEYLSGGELFHHILNNGPMPENSAKQLLCGVFSAVSYLHEMGIVHRDIKTENLIFFKKFDGEYSLKLVDFGFSTMLSNKFATSFLGTGGYMAPEIRQNKDYNSSVDNWSLGVLLYCTLSAKLPFVTTVQPLPDDREYCSKLYQLDFTTSPAWKKVSSSAKDLIRQLLNIDPLRRMTAGEAMQHKWFQSELSRLQQKRSIILKARQRKKDYKSKLMLEQFAMKELLPPSIKRGKSSSTLLESKSRSPKSPMQLVKSGTAAPGSLVKPPLRRSTTARSAKSSANALDTLSFDFLEELALASRNASVDYDDTSGSESAYLSSPAKSEQSSKKSSVRSQSIQIPKNKWRDPRDPSDDSLEGSLTRSFSNIVLNSRSSRGSYDLEIVHDDAAGHLFYSTSHQQRGIAST